MAKEIKMPQLSDTMDAGKILDWKKAEGDIIKRGDILAEVETDKADLEIESFVEGTLLRIVTVANSSAKVGEVIAYIGDVGEKVPTGDSPDVAVATSPTQSQTTHQSENKENAPITTTPQDKNIGQTPPSDSERIKASPLAKKVAKQQNIDLSQVSGSGPNGRIIKRDLENVQPTESRSTTTSLAPSSENNESLSGVSVVQQKDGVLTPLTKMRATIAKRMQESANQSPHFYTFATINMDNVLELRKIFKEKPELSGISLNHMIIKATAYALANETRVNATFRDGGVFQPGNINIGIITSLDDGLIIPVIHNADALSLKDLAFEAKSAIERARAGRATSQDLSGGTFSISNMGMFDVENFTAIINPGQGAILSVSSIRKEPAVKNDQLIIANQMRITLSVDHRIIDGVIAANFVKFFREALEQPALLMV